VVSLSCSGCFASWSPEGGDPHDGAAVAKCGNDTVRATGTGHRDVVELHLPADDPGGHHLTRHSASPSDILRSLSGETVLSDLNFSYLLSYIMFLLSAKKH